VSQASDFEHQLIQLNKTPTFSPRAYASLQCGLLIEVLKQLEGGNGAAAEKTRKHMTTFDDWHKSFDDWPPRGESQR
jgi:hypothetical protein